VSPTKWDETSSVINFRYQDCFYTTLRLAIVPSEVEPVLCGYIASMMACLETLIGGLS